MLLCGDCDRQQHQGAHLHDRQQFVSAGYWQDLPGADSVAGEYSWCAPYCPLLVQQITLIICCTMQGTSTFSPAAAPAVVKAAALVQSHSSCRALTSSPQVSTQEHACLQLCITWLLTPGAGTAEWCQRTAHRLQYNQCCIIRTCC